MIRFFMLVATALFLFASEWLWQGPLQNALSPEQGRVLMMMAWMVLWWIAEVLPLGITALIPIIYLPLMGIADLKQVCGHYADPIIFLFLGGFMLARALQKTELSERIALGILKLTGRSDHGIVWGFVLSTALLSMWISNTATALMMLPIAVSVIDFVKKRTGDHSSMDSFAVVIYLSIAYSANIGGIMTPIGTPPNVVFVGYASELLSQSVDFGWWMMVMVPIGAAMLGLQVLVLSRLFPFSVSIDENFGRFISEQLAKLGPLNTHQYATMAIFALACFLWIFKGVIHWLWGGALFTDTSIAVLAGICLFLFPLSPLKRKLTAVLEFKDIGQLSWNVVLLFGGGLALAGALHQVGMIDLWMESFDAWGAQSPWAFAMMMAALVLVLTEVMSNVALCMVAIPVIMTMAQARGFDPFVSALPATLCASFAFSLPMATPPNAIVFSTQQIRMSHMLRAGLLLNALGLILVMTLGWWLFG